jgi:MYXO-CTERM domain-containing protein
MEAASPARLYATVVGALLVVLGILGFFYSASFGGPGNVEAALGVLRVNAWLNVLHIATGALGLLVADYASRQYALGVGALYTALAIWGFAIGGGEAILGFLPASGGDEALHLVLGLLGLAAAAGTPRRRNVTPLAGTQD